MWSCVLVGLALAGEGEGSSDTEEPSEPADPPPPAAPPTDDRPLAIPGPAAPRPLDERPPAIPGPPEPAAPPEPDLTRERGMRLYLGGGDAHTASGGAGGVGAVGFQMVQRGRMLGGAYGVELAALTPAGSAFPIPVFNFDGALRLTPWLETPVVPFVTAGLGLTMLLIVPFPDVTASVGGEIALGDLRLDMELHGRVVMPLYPGTEPVNVAMLRVGLGF